MKQILFASLFCLWACQSSPVVAPDLRAVLDMAALDSASACVAEQASTLSGVSIVVGGPCRFTLAQAAAGISIPYEVRVQEDLSGIVPTAQDGGQCDPPNNGSGLIAFAQVSGDTQRYYRCDTGRCAPHTQPPFTLRAGTSAGMFTWDGKNWMGPSDTGNPEGASFPAGTYTFMISATGSRDKALFTVSTSYPITLVP